MDGTTLKKWAGTAMTDDAAERRVAMMLPGDAPGTIKVPFPVEDGAAYRTLIRGGGVSQATHKAPLGKLPLKGLTAIQKTVNRERLQAHLRDPNLIPKGTLGSGHGGIIDLPVVVQKSGTYYIHDGHHRATAAFARGDEYLVARLVDLDAK